MKLKKDFWQWLTGLTHRFFLTKAWGLPKKSGGFGGFPTGSPVGRSFPWGPRQLSAEACHFGGQHWFHPTFAAQPFRRLPIHFGGDHLLRRAAATG